jgi:hypothetical protein
MKKDDKQVKDLLDKEKERRKRAEYKNSLYSRKIAEMKAF